MAGTTNYSFPYPLDSDPVDIAGDIRNLAENIDTNINEIIYDRVGDMVSGNTESGVSVTHDDALNKLNFDVNDFTISLSGDVSASATVTNLSNTNLVVEANDFNITLSGDVSGSATVSGLTNTTIPISVSNDSHSHTSLTINTLELSDLSDVSEMFPQDAEALIYNSASGTWISDIQNKKVSVSIYSSDVTIGLADIGRIIEINSSGTVTITIPTESSVSFPAFSRLSIARLGSGTVSISPSAGVTLNSVQSRRNIDGQYGVAHLYKTGTDTWILYGDIH